MGFFAFIKERYGKKKKDTEMTSYIDLRQMTIPILILDKSWHDMFRGELKTSKIASLEKNLGILLMEQGKLNTDYKDYGSLKKDLMGNILQLTTEAFDNNNEEAIQEMERSQKYILDINGKFQEIENKRKHIENEIINVNYELFEESVKVCYESMKENQASLALLTEQIEKLREVLHQKIDTKNIKQSNYDITYTFLHKVIGAKNIEVLDEVYSED